MSTIARLPLRLAILISGRGTNMAAIARECLAGRISAEVGVVISDRTGAAGIDTARSLGIDTHVVGPAHDRGEFERALGDTLARHQPDLVVLAGFMRILSAGFVEPHVGRMLNIHPSLLPKYPGLHTHRRVLEAGDREHGASVHFVTAELDAGPLILQSLITILPGDTEESLSARVQATEYRIYPRVIGWIADGRLAWNGGRPTLDGQLLSHPIVEDMRER